MDIFILFILSLFATLLSFLSGYKLLLLYQLSSYRLKELITAIKRKGFFGVAVYFVGFLLCFFVTLTLEHILNGSKFSTLLFMLFAVLCIIFFIFFRLESKVRIIYTARFKRFILSLNILLFLLIFGVGFGLYLPLKMISYFSLCPIILLPLAFVLAHFIMLKPEKINNERYIKNAKTLLKSVRPIIVGITGSYGKTTAKRILEAMLKTKYKVLATEKNYNTPLGVSITVNNSLRPYHEVFIAEMGARYKGDIKELCAIAPPDYAFYTATGTQHLETFTSENILIETKYELAAALRRSGAAVFNGDNAGCNKMYGWHTGEKLRYSKDSFADAWYSDVVCGERGTEFTLHIGEKSVRIYTQLLGDYIPSVITGCALLSHRLGVNLQEIKLAAAGLKSVAHRLELLYNGNDIIIDDAYNSNSAGARSALKVLDSFKGRVKITVTPGLVELGEKQKEANIDFGKDVARYSDYLIVLGPNSADIIAGAQSGGMQKNKIHTVRLVEDASKIISNISGSKVILFENDLPDNY